MLFIAIPVHNEVETIGVLLWRLRSVLAEFPREYEVVVYDDASTDGTNEVLEGYRKVLPLTVLRGERQIGYAQALDHLLRHTVSQTRHPRRDAVLLLQGDFTDPPGLIPEFARRFEGGADLVVGERTTLADAPVAVQRLFRFAGWSMRPFVRVNGLHDVTSSLRLVRIAVVRDLLRERGDAPLLEGDSWTANADLLLRLIPFARRVESVPVQSTYGVRLRETRRIATRDAMAALKWAWGARKRRVKVLVADGEPARRDDARPSSARGDNDDRGNRLRGRQADDEQLSRDRAVDGDDERRSRRSRRSRDERGGRARGREDGADRGRGRERAERSERVERSERIERVERSERVERDRQRPAATTSLAGSAVGRADSDDGDTTDDDSSAQSPATRKRKRRKRSAKRPPVVDAAAETLALVDPAAGNAPDLEADDDADVTVDDADAAERPRRKKRRRRKRARGVNGESGQLEAGGDASEGDDAADGASDRESVTRESDTRESADSPYREEGSTHSADRGDDTDTDQGEAGDDSDGTRARRRGRRGRRGGRRTRRNRDVGERLAEDGSFDDAPREHGTGETRGDADTRSDDASRDRTAGDDRGNGSNE